MSSDISNLAIDERRGGSRAIVPPGREYVIAPGDDLPGVSERAYGESRFYPAIVWASSIKAEEDPEFLVAFESLELPPGRKLWIPANVDSLQASFLAADQVGARTKEASLAELGAALTAGEFTSVELVESYLERIEALDRNGPQLNAVIELNPEARAIAAAMDRERAVSGPRGPLHGIPILLKDNINTADRTQTTAGSLALLGTVPRHDAFVARRLRDAGAILLGKANLSEWANFRASRSISGWSARGSFTRNPNRLDRSPTGSSSGSAVATSANLAAAALGTETSGSIVSPAAANGVVGLKPTVGLTSRHGVVPIAHSYDTVGPLTRTVADAAIVLGVIAGPDRNDEATLSGRGPAITDYTKFLDGSALEGTRLGLGLFRGSPPLDQEPVYRDALEALRGAGSEIIELAAPGDLSIRNLLRVFAWEFKRDYMEYLKTRRANPDHPEPSTPRTIAELIEFNRRFHDRELAYFGQDLLELTAESGGFTSEEEYEEAVASMRRRSREVIDSYLAENDLDAILMPTLGSLGAPYAAMAGYPLLSLPVGVRADGEALGLAFLAGAYREPRLLALAYAAERAIGGRRPPGYALSVPDWKSSGSGDMCSPHE